MITFVMWLNINLYRREKILLKVCNKPCSVSCAVITREGKCAVTGNFVLNNILINFVESFIYVYLWQFLGNLRNLRDSHAALAVGSSETTGEPSSVTRIISECESALTVLNRDLGILSASIARERGEKTSMLWNSEKWDINSQLFFWIRFGHVVHSVHTIDMKYYHVVKSS